MRRESAGRAGPGAGGPGLGGTHGRLTATEAARGRGLPIVTCRGLPGVAERENHHLPRALHAQHSVASRRPLSVLPRPCTAGTAPGRGTEHLPWRAVRHRGSPPQRQRLSTTEGRGRGKGREARRRRRRTAGRTGWYRVPACRYQVAAAAEVRTAGRSRVAVRCPWAAEPHRRRPPPLPPPRAPWPVSSSRLRYEPTSQKSQPPSLVR